MSGDRSQEIANLQGELKVSEDRFYNVVDISPDGVVVIDQSGIIRFINDAAQTLFDRSRENLIGKEFGFPVVSGETVELSIVSSKGKNLLVEMRVKKITWDKQLAYLASLRDISEHKRLLCELDAANKELVQFGYSVSHDIRGPLRNVKTLAVWLKDKYSSVMDGQGNSDLDLIVDNVNRVLRLAEGLLQFTQIGESKKSFEMVQLNEVFDEALANISADVASSLAEISIDELPSIHANDIHLVSLFQNLLSNGIKYHGDRTPKVTVSAQRFQNYLEISIKDNGIGIEQQHWESIFLPFNRLHANSEYDGTGIGLASCKKIAELHNGRIRVESELGKGSTFVVSLPMDGDS